MLTFSIPWSFAFFLGFRALILLNVFIPAYNRTWELGKHLFSRAQIYIFDHKGHFHRHKHVLRVCAKSTTKRLSALKTLQQTPYHGSSSRFPSPVQDDIAGGPDWDEDRGLSGTADWGAILHRDVKSDRCAVSQLEIGYFGQTGRDRKLFCFCASGTSRGINSETNLLS